MGLSSFNAMRARKRAMEQANAKKAEPTPLELVLLYFYGGDGGIRTHGPG